MNRRSIYKLALTQLGRGNFRDATSNLGMKLSSKRTTRIRKDRLIYSCLQRSGRDVYKRQVQVRDLKKYFPIRRGVFRRTVGHIRAVDGVSFDIYKGCLLYTSRCV